MKKLKKMASLLLAMIMVLAMSVTAFAEGETGSITITDSKNVSVAGKTFNAYKILDVKLVGEGYVYTVPAEMKDFYINRYRLTGDEGDFDYQVAEKIAAEEDKFAFAAAALAAAKNVNIAPGTALAAADAETVTIDNLPLGYYVVEDTATTKPVSALILDTTNPNVEVAIKADKPSIDKKIDGTQDTDDSTTGDVEYNNAAIGDKVPYKVTSNVPDMTGYTKYYFVVNDTLSKGLTFNNDVVITVGNKTLIKDTDFTVTVTSVKDKDDNETGETAVEIVFKNFIQYKELKDQTGAVLAKTGSAITITYSATVDKDAVIGTIGNPNEVTLIYSNNPNVTDNGTSDNPDKPTPNSPIGETPKKETRTYVTDIEVIKVDPQGNRLAGAEFKIEGTKLNTVLVRTDVYTQSENGEYWKLKDGSYTTIPPVSATDETDTSKYYENTTTKYVKSVKEKAIVKTENVSYTGVVGDDGVLRFEGLSAGIYIITEIKAPAGYNLLTQPITVTINWTAPDANSTECTWAYEGTDTVNETHTNHVTITNNAGAELPSTGGMGTTLFYIIGGILVLAAAVLLITKRRMNAEK